MRMIGLVLGTVLAGTFAVPAQADPAPPPAPAAAPAAPAAPLTVTRPDTDKMARRMARRAARLDESLKAVRSGLKLTPAQDAMWPPVADAIHGLDTARGIGFRQELAAADSSIDGLKLQGDRMARMGAAMGRLADATKPLVASLSPDQKSRLPSLLEDVPPRKLMDRAFGVPQDSDVSSGKGPGGAAAAPEAQRAGARANAPGSKDEPQDRNDDE